MEEIIVKNYINLYYAFYIMFSCLIRNMCKLFYFKQNIDNNSNNKHLISNKKQWRRTKSFYVHAPRRYPLQRRK